MPNSSHGATAAIAEFVAGTHLTDLPAEVVEHARLVTLDTMGAMIAAQQFPVGQIITAYVADLGDRPHSRVLGSAVRASAPTAAYANGTLAHGLDFDDHKHLSTHTLPAAFAVGEFVGASTKLVLEAYVLGREVGAKLGSVIEAQRKSRRGPTYRGWYRVGVVGPIAAAVSAGVVLGLTDTALRHAIGVAASSSAGLRRNQGTMAKALHAGNAARDGVHAALLAARGFTADVDILESDLGLVNAICLPGEADWSALAGLGTPFDLAGVPAIKRYPACSPSHKPVTAVLKLRAANGFTIDEIAAVEADLHTFSLMRTDPQEAIATGYSLPYLLSVALLDGQVGLEQISANRLHDPAVRALMAKVHHDPAAAQPGRPERVTVRLTDGRVLRAEQDTKPDLHDWISVSAKFSTCATSALSDAQVLRLHEAVQSIPDDRAISEVLDLTAPDWSCDDHCGRQVRQPEKVTEQCS